VAVERLMEQLLQRRSRVRELIVSFRDSDRAPFPRWAALASVTVLRNFEERPSGGNFVM
jgi:hypothetical protein